MDKAKYDHQCQASSHQGPKHQKHGTKSKCIWGLEVLPCIWYSCVYCIRMFIHDKFSPNMLAFKYQYTTPIRSCYGDSGINLSTQIWETHLTPLRHQRGCGAITNCNNISASHAQGRMATGGGGGGSIDIHPKILLFRPFQSTKVVS